MPPSRKNFKQSDGSGRAAGFVNNDDDDSEYSYDSLEYWRSKSNEYAAIYASGATLSYSDLFQWDKIQKSTDISLYLQGTKSNSKPVI